MNIEKIWYELSPYLFGATGASANLYSPGSILLEGSGLLLFTVAATVVALRWIYRTQGGARPS